MVDTGVFFVMEQACWRLLIIGEALLTIFFDTALSFVSKWALMYFGAFFFDIGMQHQGKGWQGTC